MKDKKKYCEISKKALSSSKLCSIDNRIASRIVYYLQDLPLTPNQLSFTSLILAVTASLGLLVLNSTLIFIIGIILAYTFDNVDGIWARVMDQRTSFGTFLDRFLDYLKEYLFDVALMAFFVKEFRLSLYLFIFFAFYFSIKGLYYLSFVLKRSQKRDKLKWIVLGPAEKYIIVIPLIVLIEELIGLYFVALFMMYIMFIFNNIKYYRANNVRIGSN